MASYNKVILMGNLTRDPEIRHTQGGMAVCSASIAVNEKFKDGQGEWQERSTFVDVTIWGKRGEAFAKYHKKVRARLSRASYASINGRTSKAAKNEASYSLLATTGSSSAAAARVAAKTAEAGVAHRRQLRRRPARVAVTAGVHPQVAHPPVARPQVVHRTASTTRLSRDYDVTPMPFALGRTSQK